MSPSVVWELFESATIPIDSFHKYLLITYGTHTALDIRDTAVKINGPALLELMSPRSEERQ